MFSPTAELAIPIGITTNKAKAEIETPHNRNQNVLLTY